MYALVYANANCINCQFSENLTHLVKMLIIKAKQTILIVYVYYKHIHIFVKAKAQQSALAQAWQRNLSNSVR